MPYDFDAPRLFVPDALAAGAEFRATQVAANHLVNVLRLRVGAGVLVFNGRDGEWRATLAAAGKRETVLRAEEASRAQTPAPDLWYLFAPLKHARLDYMVQKAVEMGAGRLLPVMTRRTQAARVNRERMLANAVGAAEQCGILSIPEIGGALPLESALAGWPEDRTLVFCDETADPGEGAAELAELAGTPLALLVGPEGGFDPGEREGLLALGHLVRLSLGPRILRADTAAVAALALMQAAAGDWR